MGGWLGSDDDRSLAALESRRAADAAGARWVGLPVLALRFILEHRAVSTTIPGMRRPAHVERNLAASDGVRLPPRLTEALKTHRWDRQPTVTP